jgi:hypothetical protein
MKTSNIFPFLFNTHSLFDPDVMIEEDGISDFVS